MKKQISLLCSVLLVTMMVAISELTGEHEILFPEIAAIVTGAFVSPKFSWNTSLLRMLLLLCVSAILGTLMVLLPFPFLVQMCSAFLVASFILLCSGTTFAPMISAIVLPVMLQTKSIVYPISAILLSSTVVLLRKVLEHYKILPPVEYHPQTAVSKHSIVDLLIRWICGCLVVAVAVLTNHPLMTAPPLLVAFTEFWKINSKAQQHPYQVTILVTACAGIGAFFRYLSLMIGFYQFIASGVTILLVLFMMKKLNLFIPPASAIAILAYLIPADKIMIYPFLIGMGTSCFVALSVIHGKILLKHDEKSDCI